MVMDYAEGAGYAVDAPDASKEASLREKLNLCERCGRANKDHVEAKTISSETYVELPRKGMASTVPVPCDVVPYGQAVVDKKTSNMTLADVQREHRVWSQHNFAKVKQPHHPVFGMLEELGELAHSILKKEQGIRGTPAEHDANSKDAIGDLLVFLADYCNMQGWDAQEILEQTWKEVRIRDWKKFPKNGKTE